MQNQDNKYLLDYYRLAFLSLKQRRTSENINLAKPILVLSVLDCIEEGDIVDNKIIYNVVKKKYEKLLSTAQEAPTPMKYPFYHLVSDGFWHITWNSGVIIPAHSPSDKFLRENIAFASFDNALWDLLREQTNRDFYRKAIIGYYKIVTKDIQ